MGSTVIHLAGIVGTDKVQDLSDSLSINVDATLDFAQKCINRGVARFIYVSTSHVYGPCDKPIDEATPTNPMSQYAKQKLLAEEGLSGLFDEDESTLVVTRLFSVLDNRMPDFSLGGVITRLMNNVNDEPVIVSNSEDRRDFLDLQTISDTLVRIGVSNIPGGVYNLCSGKTLTVRDAISRYLAHYGVTGVNALFDGANSQVPSLAGRNNKLLEALPDLHIRWRYN